MKECNGVKIFSMGDVDSFYAKTKETAIERAVELFGESFLGDDGDVPFSEVVEYSDEMFDKASIIKFDNNDQPIKDSNGDYITISAKDHLLELMKDGETNGHFSTTEW